MDAHRQEVAAARRKGAAAMGRGRKGQRKRVCWAEWCARVEGRREKERGKLSSAVGFWIFQRAPSLSHFFFLVLFLFFFLFLVLVCVVFVVFLCVSLALSPF